MIDSSVKKSPWALVRLGVLILGLCPVAFVLIWGVFWLHDNIPRWRYWQAGLMFLIVLKAVYVTALVAAMLGTLSLGALMLWRRRGTTRRSIGRGLLACVSLLFALAVAETATAIWQYRVHRASAMPVAGSQTTAASGIARTATAEAPPDVEMRGSTPKFPDPPGDRQIDLVMVGESSAEGVPLQQWLSIDRIVAWQLGRVIPDRPIRVTSLATSGEILEQQHRRLMKLDRRPDIVIIYCGHNEFKARYSPTTTADYYTADRLPNTIQTLIEWIAQIERFSPFCGLIVETAQKCRISIPPSLDETRELIDVPVYSAEEYAKQLSVFKRRLEAMVSYTERVGALPILILPPANDAGYAPNRSFLPPSTPRGDRAAFESEFLAAERTEDQELAASIQRFRELLKRQPGFAETHYRLARLLERAGAPDEAYVHYVAARDFDGYPMRCLTAFQEAYREVAARHHCPFIDGQAYFRKIGQRGQLGDDLFPDIMHPALRGHIALAQAVLRVLKAKGALGWPSDAPVAPIDPAACVAHFGLDGKAWAHLCHWEKTFNERVLPLRYDRSQRLQKRAAAIRAMEQLSQGMAPESVGLPSVGIPEPVPMVSYTGGEADAQTP
jgi:lysophospholipase L1-like esterase